MDRKGKRKTGISRKGINSLESKVGLCRGGTGQEIYWTRDMILHNKGRASTSQSMRGV